MKVTNICEYLRKNFFNSRRFYALIIVISLVQTFTSAQLPLNNIHHEAIGITTVQFHPVNDSLALPVTQLGIEDYLALSFDQIRNSHTEPLTLHYSIQHHNIDWQPSDMLEIDFYDGFNRIYDNDSYDNSFNTTTSYIHYQLIIPTEPIKASGNYTITIYDDNDNVLLIRPFMIYEPIVGIKSRINKDFHPKGNNPQTQTLSFAIIHPTIHTNNAATEFHTAVWQNNAYWTYSIIDQPSFIRQNELVFDNASTFEAGNEFRWADNRSLRYNGLHVIAIDYHEPLYYFTLASDKLPLGYYFHHDFNGQQYIEAFDIHQSPSFAADYNMLSFTFTADRNLGNLYLFGEITEYQPVKMNYDPATHTYNILHLTKQGLHSYQYLTSTNNPNQPFTFIHTEGNFAETENDYYIAVYYRPMGSTTDRLVGYKLHNSLNTSNDFIH